MVNRLILVMLVLIPVYGKRVESRWSERAPLVDGDVQEWFNDEVSLRNEGLLAVANDSQYIYISFRVSNREEALRYAKNGVTIWMDREGKRNKVAGITVASPPQYSKRGETPKLCDLVPHNGEMVGIRFNEKPAVFREASYIQECQIQARYGCDGGNSYSVEVAIPCRRSYGETAIFSVPTQNKVVRIGIEPGRSKRKIGRKGDNSKAANISMGRGGGKGGGGRGGGGGKGGMGGKGGGMRGGGSSGHSAPVDDEPSVCWVKVKLAQK